MGVLRFIWRGVLAFDRIGSRIPQLVQMWLIELFFMMPVTFFVAAIIDSRGAFGVPGTGEGLDGGDWVALAIGLGFGFLFIKSLVRPKVRSNTWTPMVSADVGDVTVFGGNRAWSVSYTYLTSHPSYILLLLLTAPIPVVMLWATENQGGNSFYFRAAGIVGLCVLGLMALSRLLAWYVFRFGRAQLDAQSAQHGITQRKLAWEIAWKPVLMLVVMIYAIGAIPIAYMWWDELRTIDELPVVTADDWDRTGEFFRVEGVLADEPVWWAPRGTGRGGDNYAGAGALVDLESGGDALLLAEALSVPDFVGVLNRVKGGVGGEVATHGRVIDDVTPDQQEYYGFDLDDFPDAPDEGRVMVLLEYP